MVYCPKCGLNNQDDATYCVSCGTNLTATRKARLDEHEEMCFGRRGGGFWGIVFGFIIVIFGVTVLLQQLYGVRIEFWPLLLVVIGILIIVGVVSRRRT
jgi:uncharacterized membrane protein YvbJ